MESRSPYQAGRYPRSLGIHGEIAQPRPSREIPTQRGLWGSPVESRSPDQAGRYSSSAGFGDPRWNRTVPTKQGDHHAARALGIPGGIAQPRPSREILTSPRRKPGPSAKARLQPRNPVIDRKAPSPAAKPRHRPQSTVSSRETPSSTPKHRLQPRNPVIDPKTPSSTPKHRHRPRTAPSAAKPHPEKAWILRYRSMRPGSAKGTPSRSSQAWASLSAIASVSTPNTMRVSIPI